MTKYRCPSCKAVCVTPYCFSCGVDIPQSQQFDDKPAVKKASPPSEKTYNVKIGDYFFANTDKRVFKVAGQTGECSYDDLIEFELYEDNETVLKGGVGRAVVGGALFGGVGAVVGATTRKSKRIVNSLYIRISTRSVGMLKIVFIRCETPMDSFTYRVSKDFADKIISQLETIADSNKNNAPGTGNNNSAFVADELLKLKQLLDMGVLTKEEFESQKKKILNR